jgi:Ca-activated chloride channel family protein
MRTTAQVNLLDAQGRPAETDVGMTLYDEQSGSYRYNYMHTLNYLERPDTLFLDEDPSYRLVAHTIPETEKTGIKLTLGKHNVIALDAPQGFLEIRRSEGVYNFNERVKCVVRKSGNAQILNVQQMNSVEKYITGSYDLEILTLPRIYIQHALLEQSKANVIEIPHAGALKIKSLESGDGCILLNKGSRLEWVSNLGQQTIQTYLLQPGDYVIVWRGRSLRGSIYSIEKKVTVKPDSEISLELYK